MAKQKEKEVEPVIRQPETYSYEDSLEQRYDEIPEPNVIFVGKRWTGGEWKTKMPPPFIITAEKRIDLPDAETQQKGFFHPDAELLIKSFPADYKQFIKKGEK